jgi:hypothetical protein
MSLITQGFGADIEYDAPSPSGAFPVVTDPREAAPPIGNFPEQILPHEPVAPEHGQFG